MNIGPLTTLRELAFIVCTALNAQGTTAVLSGGGAATVYAPDVNQSRDLDLILSYSALGAYAAVQPLLELGFEESGGMYRHALTPFTVEFPPGPLAIGDEVIKAWDTMREGEFVLHILSPTDCVRDRLAWFLHYNDFSALEQALGVARKNPINLDRIQEWCIAEGKPERFAVFRSRFDSS